MFRNQTSITTQKAKAYRNTSSKQIPKTIHEPQENQALCSFFTEYVFTKRQRPEVPSSLDLLTPIYVNAKPDSALFPVVSAVAFAHLSLKPDRRQLDTRAKQLYSFAVTSVKNALANPVKSQSDDTLLAIHLLSLYEGLTANAETITTWGSHAAGAAALATYRTGEMRHNWTSRALYWIICALFIIRNTLHCKPMDPFRTLHDVVSKSIAPQMAPATEGDKLTWLSMKVPLLRSIAARVMRQPVTPTLAAELEELLHHARLVDQELSSWGFDLPPTWRVRRVGYASRKQGPIELADCWPGPIDAYYNLWVCNYWNNQRFNRIFCQSIILNCIERLVPPTRYTERNDYRVALIMLRRMVDEICASIPFHLKDKGLFYDYAEKFDNARWDPDSRTHSTPAGIETTLDADNLSQGIGAYVATYALYIAHSVVCIHQDQKAWINGRLDYIIKNYHIGGASVLKARGISSQQNGRAPSASDMAPPPYAPFENQDSPSSTEAEIESPLRKPSSDESAFLDPDGFCNIIPKLPAKNSSEDKPSQLYSYFLPLSK